VVTRFDRINFPSVIKLFDQCQSVGQWGESHSRLSQQN